MRTRVDSPRRHETSGGRIIYALCIQVFPGFFGNVYVVDDGSHRYLIDCGSVWELSNQNLVDAFASIESELGARLRLSDLDAILVTHGHMDHFGGVQFVREHCDAPIGVHVLDRPILAGYEERVIVASQQLRIFLGRCGLSEKSREGLMRMYMAGKSRYRSIEVGFLLADGEPVLVPSEKGPIDLKIGVYHVPGHCPGQVCLVIDDVMITADHVLSRTTPHQAPESITLNTGLEHYLISLRRMIEVTGIRLGLGGHEEPVEDVPARAAEIIGAHQERLDKVLNFCSEPQTMGDVSRKLFGGLKSYDVLLGLEEAGAHVEYLHQRGELVAANLDELEKSADAVPLYRQA